MNGEFREFDLRVLENYLVSRLPDMVAPLSVNRFGGGQSNPTYRLIDASGHLYVLRKKPAGELLPSAHAVDREFRVMKALAGTAVPVPRMHTYCEDPDVVGTPFFVMEHVEGRIFWDPAIPELDNRERQAAYEDINRVIAALHSVDPEAVGLSNYGRPGGFIERQVDRWTRQYRASETHALPAMERLIEWLPMNLPPTKTSGIFHGDLRIDNMIFHPTEPKVIAVLDWELSTLGDPVADIAYHALPWRLTAKEFRGMADKDLRALNIPSEAEYLRRYSERTGRVIASRDWEFYMAYSLFRLASILQGILKRSIDGTASSADARATGEKAALIAQAGWAQIERGTR